VIVDANSLHARHGDGAHRCSHFAGAVCDTTNPTFPHKPHISPQIPTFPHKSPHFPTNPHISPQIPTNPTKKIVGRFPRKLKIARTSQKSHLVKTSYTGGKRKRGICRKCSVCCRLRLFDAPPTNSHPERYHHVSYFSIPLSTFFFDPDSLQPPSTSFNTSSNNTPSNVQNPQKRHLNKPQ
jgi:hypothetical protein